jgi:hypothetical protein
MWGQPPSAVHRAEGCIGRVGRTLLYIAFDSAFDLELNS